MNLDEFLFEGNKLEIISQNLFNYRKKNRLGREQVKIYSKKYVADIYAFQEYPEWGRGKTFYTTFYLPNKEYKENICDVKKLWEDIFTWSDFPKRYWSELVVWFNNVRIIIINVHICSSYDDQLRLVLLKRLERLAGKEVILLGDFNAAFLNQTDKMLPGNDIFLSKIKNIGYDEMLGNDEEVNLPHYTYALKNSKTKLWERKKLDHVFVSKEMNDREWKLNLEYIDDVNLYLFHINGNIPSNKFTDHSGLKLVIEAQN